MGVLMLMAMAAPSAHAQVTFFDFENAAAAALFPGTPYPADVGQGALSNLTFPGGGIVIEPTGGNPDGVLDLKGNTTQPGSTYCFEIGAINTTGLTDITLSFDLKSQGESPNPTANGQFSTLTLYYSTDNITFTQFAQDTNLHNETTYALGFHTYNLSALTGGAVNNQSTLYIEFCFTGSTNTAEQNHTFLDNISITAVPEPATVFSGVLAAVGLCWHQRKRLSAVLRARLA